jgi:hypothetical protein
VSSSTIRWVVANSLQRRRHQSSKIAHNSICYFVLNRRCFKALGFDEYSESHGDGLQILRYNLTTAYTPHMDWIEDKVSTFLAGSFIHGDWLELFTDFCTYFMSLDKKGSS